MKLQNLPKLNARPSLYRAQEAHVWTRAKKIESTIEEAYSNCADVLVSLDGTEHDYNPSAGIVVVVDQTLKGKNRSQHVAAASLEFDQPDGMVRSFEVVTDDTNFLSFRRSGSTPVFTQVLNGKGTTYEIDPKNGKVASFER